MGIPHIPQPVKLFVAMLSMRADILDQAASLLVEHFGPLDHVSPDIPFDFTDYYNPTMGENLLRRLLSFANPVESARLADIKLLTNRMEQDFAERRPAPVERPLNLDPGYLTLAKVVLATTKDYDHRLYLADGIFAEVTLHYHKGRYQPWPWTYPDYRSEPYQQFFAAMRERLA